MQQRVRLLPMMKERASYAASRVLTTLLVSLCLPAAGWAQAPGAAKADHAAAYYYFTLAHFYADLAGSAGNRGEFVTKAIDNYKAAIKADPDSAMLSEELSELYFATGRFREAQTDAEEALKANPNDLNAHRLLAKIYTRQIGEGGQGKIDEAMLKKTIEEYQKITSIDPKDADSWVMLGRLLKVSQNSVDERKAFEKALEAEPDNEDALTGLALIYEDAGDHQKAADALRKATEKAPTGRSLEALAGVYEQMREFDLATETIKKALELNPPNATDLKRALAQDYIFGNHLNDALGVYQGMVDDDGNDIQSYLGMSKIYRQQREYAKAREVLAKAKAVEPTSIEIRYDEATLLDAEGKTAEATQAIKDILASTAKKSYNKQERGARIGLLEALASMYSNSDQTEQAVDTFRQMTDVDPDLAPRVSASITDTYRQGKLFPKAEQESEAAIKKWPTDRNVIFARASLLADLGKTDEAASSVKKLLDGKNDKEIYIRLAQIYDKGKKFGEVGKALDSAEKLAQNDDDHVNIWFLRGAMYERMKNVESAETEFQKVLKVEPDNPGALNYIGYMLADRNMRLEEALKFIQKALDKDPENGAYLDSLGWAYYRLGRYSEAEDTLRRAVDKTPKDPTVHDHFADTLLKENKIKEAVVQLQASMKEWETSPPADYDAQEAGKVKSKLEAAKTRLSKETAKK
jgi:tetratricopeptide (TPR) repeat protein